MADLIELTPILDETEAAGCIERFNALLAAAPQLSDAPSCGASFGRPRRQWDTFWVTPLGPARHGKPGWFGTAGIVEPGGRPEIILEFTIPASGYDTGKGALFARDAEDRVWLCRRANINAGNGRIPHRDVQRDYPGAAGTSAQGDWLALACRLDVGPPEVLAQLESLISGVRAVREMHRPGPGVESPPLLVAQLDRLLAHKGQVILHGPPGTGKTWAAKRYAEWLNAEYGQGTHPGPPTLVSFHPAYGYEDFIGGYRPSGADGGSLTWRIEHGRFLDACAKAGNGEDEPWHVLIIDEINRGNVPRIFGDLITAIEIDKREDGVMLPWGEVLTVPRNLLIIATMNTADRSIRSLDAALRRRFGFVRVDPDPSLLPDRPIGRMPSPRRLLTTLNARIHEHLDEDKQLGHSYLMREGVPLDDEEDLHAAFVHEILPLLEEHCWDSRNAELLARILGRGLVHPTGGVRRDVVEDLARCATALYSIVNGRAAGADESVLAEG